MQEKKNYLIIFIKKNVKVKIKDQENQDMNRIVPFFVEKDFSKKKKKPLLKG